MDASRLRRLISGGESQTVDFKRECNAFHGDSGATAELAKDIIAMANNGNRYSYLVIGVSDDGTELKSCRNTNLNDEAVQDLLKTAVHPLPRFGEPGYTVGDRRARQAREVALRTRQPSASCRRTRSPTVL